MYSQQKTCWHVTSWIALLSRDDKQRWWWPAEDEKRRLRRLLQQCWADWQTVDEQLWSDRYFLCDTSILYCKNKLVFLLRLGYLKPFLAGSKKTRQGPGCRVGALCISRCWFCLTIVAEPKLIQKDYKITWCCVLLCYGSWWFKCLCYVNNEVKWND